jgi:lipoate-protein ligase A
MAVRKADNQQSLEWTYLQTPQFTISTQSDEDLGTNLELSVRYGSINGATLSVGDSGTSQRDLGESLTGHKVHEIADWEGIMDKALSEVSPDQRVRLIKWFNKMLPSVQG